MNVWQMICGSFALVFLIAGVLFQCRVLFMKRFFLQYGKLTVAQKEQLDEGMLFAYFSKLSYTWTTLMIAAVIGGHYSWLNCLAFLLALVFVLVKDFQKDVEEFYSRFRHHDFR